MSEFNYTREVVRSMRRMFGQDTPMNVFPKTFTRTPSVFEGLVEHCYDAPQIGSTITIRKPVRFGLIDEPKGT